MALGFPKFGVTGWGSHSKGYSIWALYRSTPMDPAILRS